jgi:hypothetical protein
MVAMVEACSNSDAVSLLKDLDPGFQGEDQMKMNTNGRSYKPKGRRGRLQG